MQAAGDRDDDGVSIPPAALGGGSIETANGTPADRAFDAVPPDDRRRVDAQPPTITGVEIVAPANGTTFLIGEDIDIRISFTDAVHVVGLPVVTLSVGPETREAAFASGSGTDALLFRYAVQSGDRDDDGVSIPPVGGGSIETASGTPADRAFDAVPPDDRRRVDAQPPTITGVEIVAPANGTTFLIGEDIDIRISFTDAVHVVGLPVVTLSVGPETREAAFASGSGTDALLFRYAVQPATATTTASAFPPTRSAAARSKPPTGRRPIADAVPPDDRRRVDAVVPRVQTVAVVSDPGDDDNYAPGERIEIAIRFSDAVHVTDTPAVTFSVGGQSRTAAFAAGSGTRRLLFAYVVANDDYDDDGISIGANALGSGTIEDANGNPADRSFAALAAQSRHRVGVEIAVLLTPLSLPVGREESVDLAAALATVGILQLDGYVVASDDADVAVGRTAGGILTITAIGEGTTTIRASARRGTLALLLPVTVETSAEETAVLQSALAAVGRGVLASVANTIGARLESPRASPLASSPRFTALALGAGPAPFPVGLDARHGVFQDSVADMHDGFSGQRRLAGSPGGLPGGPARLFALLAGIANPASSWGVWGAADVQAFEGEADAGAYDGRLTSLHLGADARGEGWVAGASVARSLGEVSYEYRGDVRGSGTLDTELTTVHPYLQWSPGEAATFWTVLGFGTGEASVRREEASATGEPSDLSMRLGLAGLRYDLGQRGAFALALRADAGFVALESADGQYAAHGLEVDAQRLRASLEASLPIIAGGGVFTPFVDLGARWDGGDGQTGGGLEVAGGVRYGSASVGIEVKARTLALHGGDGVAEHGLAATVFVEPGPKATGWRLSLTPRWGTVAFRDVFWQRNADLHNLARARREPGWTLDGRVGYGFGLRGRPGTLTPFTEFDVARTAASRARFGVRFQPDGTPPDRRSSFELASERVVHAGYPVDNRLLFVAEARF